MRRRNLSLLGAAGLGAGGLFVSWLLAIGFGVGVHNATVLSLLSGAAAAGAGVLGAAVLYLCRARSTGLQLAIVALTSLVGVGGGTLAAGWAMFLTGPDARDMVVMLIASGAVGMMVASMLSRNLVASTRALTAKAGMLGGMVDHAGVPAEGDAMEMMRTRDLEELRKRIEDVGRDLAESESKRRSLEASRRELVAWVSHDLRTPLAGLRSMAEALEDGTVEDPATIRRYHATIARQVEELSRLVDDLFELSRINAGVLHLDLEPASIDDLLSDAVSLAGPIADAKGVTIKGSISDAIGSVELATPEFLRVLQNLLDNAIRHSPPNGEVTVEAGTMNSHAFVSVRDSCGGIPEQEIDRVFEMAYRGESARGRAAGGGAGLGLAIARGLIAAQHGNIEVRNEEDGCRFTVTLPLAVGS